MPQLLALAVFVFSFCRRPTRLHACRLCCRHPGRPLAAIPTLSKTNAMPTDHARKARCSVESTGPTLPSATARCVRAIPLPGAHKARAPLAQCRQRKRRANIAAAAWPYEPSLLPACHLPGELSARSRSTAQGVPNSAGCALSYRVCPTALGVPHTAGCAPHRRVRPTPKGEPHTAGCAPHRRVCPTPQDVPHTAGCAPQCRVRPTPKPSIRALPAPSPQSTARHPPL
eukprot:359009-Chlamydomonas_euryale.AAC.5